MIGKSKLAPVMFIAWMLPDAFSCDEVEIVNVSCWALTARHNGLDLAKTLETISVCQYSQMPKAQKLQPFSIADSIMNHLNANIPCLPICWQRCLEPALCNPHELDCLLAGSMPSQTRIFSNLCGDLLSVMLTGFEKFQGQNAPSCMVKIAAAEPQQKGQERAQNIFKQASPSSEGSSASARLVSSRITL